MGVLVALSPAEFGGAAVMGVHEVGRHIVDFSRMDIMQRCVQCFIGPVGFRAGRHEDHCMGKRNLRFGEADHLGRLHTGCHDRDRVRIGHPDVLAGHDHQTPADHHLVSTAVDETGQVVDRRIRIRTPH